MGLDTYMTLYIVKYLMYKPTYEILKKGSVIVSSALKLAVENVKLTFLTEDMNTAQFFSLYLGL